MQPSSARLRVLFVSPFTKVTTTSFVPRSSMAATNNFNKPPRFTGRSIGIPHISYSYDRISVFVARTSPALQEGNAAVPLGCFVMKTLKQSAYAFYGRTLIEATIRIPRVGWRRRAGKTQIHCIFLRCFGGPKLPPPHLSVTPERCCCGPFISSMIAL